LSFSIKEISDFDTMKVNIDPTSGFCFGVKRAIQLAESEIPENELLFSLGDIVHNEEEIKRLEKLGIQTIDHKNFSETYSKKVLFRAHGEPPSSYQKAKDQNCTLVDATCPIVLKFQQKVKKAWEEMKSCNGQVVILGKRSHPEVIGLLGHTDNKAIVIEDLNDLSLVNTNLPIRLFVQTTKSKEDFDEIVNALQKKIQKDTATDGDFKFYNTICRQVSGRVPALKRFCRENDAIVFVGGKNSSNGKQLFAICKQENANSYFISSDSEVKEKWFINKQTVGITGATSTPAWLLEKVSRHLQLI